MKAIYCDQEGSPDVLRIKDVAKPVALENQVLIQVHYTSVNRADLLIRSGKIPGFLKKFPVLGAEVSGVITEVGSNVKTLKVGDIVVGINYAGGYAEYISLDQELVFSLPKNLSMAEMVAIPEAYVTAYQLLKWKAKVNKNDTILVYAAGSTVGLALIQLAGILGVNVIACSRSVSKRKLCIDLGAKEFINTSKVGFESKFKNIDCVFDPVGGDYFKKALKSLNTNGCYIIYGNLSDSVAELDFEYCLKHWIEIKSVTFQSHTLQYKQKLLTECFSFLNPYFEKGLLKMPIDQEFLLKDMALAHKKMESNATQGKIVIRVK